MENNRISTRTLTGLALFTAIVVVLQFLGAFVRFGPFSISLVLIPIVVGAALYGPLAGAWLGVVFGLVVLLSGDAAPFLKITAAIGVVFSAAFMILQLVPIPGLSGVHFGTESYIMLAVWVVIGAIFYAVQWKHFRAND